MSLPRRWLRLSHGPIVPVLVLALTLLAAPALAQASDVAGSVEVLVPVPPASTAVAAPVKIDQGDTAWVLMSSALVLMMTPALAFFYGGLVRRKNVLSILMQCMMIMCILSVQWVLFGYSLSFGPDVGHAIGNLSWLGLKGVSMATPNADYAPTIPHGAFMIFQCMFAIITPALILGAFAERMKFSAFVIFTLLWATLVYDPVCHWVWGVGGFMRNWGSLDFAGGTVVHINAGMAALAAALVMGKRFGYPGQMSPPHNLPFAVLGAGLLWFGWFGFNAGSALGANGIAVGAFVATNTAAATAGLTWALLDWALHKHSTMLGMITGAVAGLVAITPAAGFVDPMGAIAIGVGAAVIPYLMVMCAKPRLGYDDSLDAFGVHGIGGIWGSIATGIFCQKAVNPAGADGLLYGNPHQLWVQLQATAVTVVYSFVFSFVLFKVLDLVMGLKASEHQQRVGLDLTYHREAAYTVID